jgi:hypothetical protein
MTSAPKGEEALKIINEGYEEEKEEKEKLVLVGKKKERKGWFW